MALDEAFAGFDANNQKNYLDFLSQLGFCWIITAPDELPYSESLSAAMTYRMSLEGTLHTAFPILWNGSVSSGNPWPTWGRSLERGLSREREAFAAMREAGLEPVLAAARQKVYEADGLRGRVRLTLGAAQLDELANLLGRVSVRDGQVLVPLQDLDAALTRSRFRTGLLDVLEAGYGPIVTRRQEREAAASRWASWLKQVGNLAAAGGRGAGVV